MGEHIIDVRNAGYCGGCETCGSKEESYVCLACGTTNENDFDFPCPAVEDDEEDEK